jgi:hypothetical protein
MATVRPFPSPPSLRMDSIPSSSDRTSLITSNSLLNTVSNNQPLLRSAANYTNLKKIGIIISQLELTQVDSFIAANQVFNLDFTQLICLRSKLEGQPLTQKETKNLINSFTQGKSIT